MSNAPILIGGVQGPPGPLAVSVSAASDLAGYPVGTYLCGTLAFVQSTNSYYSWYPTGISPPSGVPTVAGNGGVWALAVGSSGTVSNASWLVTDWYVDPVNGVDSNVGTSSSVPVKTVTGGIIAKWGTRAPILEQTTTLHFLNGETVGQEDVVLSPVLVGGVNLVLSGTSALGVVAMQTIATLTAKNRSTGQRLQFTVSSATGIAVGQKVINTTRNSAATVTVVSGTTITVSEPFTLLTASSAAWNLTPAPDDGWATGNALKFYNRPDLNLKVLGVRGGDETSAAAGGVCYVQDFYIPDASGTAGNSTFSPNSPDVFINFVDCGFGPYLVTLPGAGDDNSVCLVNCWLQGGCGLTDAQVFGGWAPSGIVVQGNTLCDFDVQTASYEANGPNNFIGTMYSAGQVQAYEGASVIPDNVNVTCAFWGPGSLDTLGEVGNRSGLTYVTWMLLAGGMTIRGSSAGTHYNGGAWTTATVSPANVDAYGGLAAANPIQGGKYY